MLWRLSSVHRGWKFAILSYEKLPGKHTRALSWTVLCLQWLCRAVGWLYEQIRKLPLCSLVDKALYARCICPPWQTSKTLLHHPNSICENAPFPLSFKIQQKLPLFPAQWCSPSIPSRGAGGETTEQTKPQQFLEFHVEKSKADLSGQPYSP